MKRCLKHNSFVFILHRFQLIMDLLAAEEDETIYPDWTKEQRQEEISRICNEYITYYRLTNYPVEQIWRIIERKYYKDWDDLLYKTLKT